jgi:hypothetical protein
VTPLYPQKVGSKIRQPIAVAHSVYFTCGLKATEFAFVCLDFIIILFILLHILDETFYKFVLSYDLEYVLALNVLYVAYI